MAYQASYPMGNDSSFPESGWVVKLTTQLDRMPKVKETNELHLDLQIRFQGVELYSAKMQLYLLQHVIPRYRFLLFVFRVVTEGVGIEIGQTNLQSFY
jgi:hypothetical protein